MVVLESCALKIVTDSGGVQREAFALGIPCITCDSETEWTETVADGWNLLVDADAPSLVAAITDFQPTGHRGKHYGSGDAAGKIVHELGSLG